MSKKHIYRALRSAVGVVAFAFTALTFYSFKTGHQGAGQLIWQDEPIKFKPNGFYIAEVQDVRPETHALGQIVASTETAGDKTQALVPATLQGGINTVTLWLKHSFPQQAGYRPVVIKINTLHIAENILNNGGVDGKIDVAFTFELKTGEDMSVKLVSYKGSSHYTRTLAQQNVVAPILRTSIENAITFFNNWLPQHAETNPLLAKAVVIRFTDYHEQPEGDTIYYSKNRPITWDDFKDHPRNTIFAAEVMPGLGYDEKTSISKGVIYVDVAMRAYLPKSACWVREGIGNDYILNHEQRHFDLVKIISERFKRKLKEQELPVLNYDGNINAEYLETLRELSEIQKRYDSETAHGTNVAAQEKWNEYIDAELKKTVS